MLKKFVFASLALAASCSATAQATDVAVEPVVEESVVTEKVTTRTALAADWKSNWFISAGAGAQVFFGDHERQMKFGDRISPALDVAVGKWITPSVGVRLMYSGLYAKGATQTWGKKDGGIYNTGKEIPGKYTNAYGYLCEQKINFMNLHIDFMLNLCNLIGGYSPTRVYGCSPYIGVGYGHVFAKQKQQSVSGNIGVFNSFRLSKHFDFNIDIRATVFNDGFDGEIGRRDFDGLLTASAGFTWKIGGSNWKTQRTIITSYDNTAVNELRAQVDDLNNRLANQKPQTVVETREVVKSAAGDYIVLFPIGKSILGNADKAQLELAADAIKEAGAGTQYTVTGYADKDTGTAAVNEALSRARAQSVYDFLVKKGVPASQLKMEWKGGVSNMFFDDPALSRSVIIRAK